MHLGLGLQGLSQPVWTKCCQLGNRSRSHGCYLRQPPSLCLSWYSYFLWVLQVQPWNNWEMHVRLPPSHTVRCWKQEGNLSAPSTLSNGGALQKHAKVRQTVAPLATFLMHVIALATRPPCIASQLSDRLFHLWVWAVKLTKTFSWLEWWKL